MASCPTDFPDNLSSAQTLTTVIPGLSTTGFLWPSMYFGISQPSMLADERLYSSLAPRNISHQLRRLLFDGGSILFPCNFWTVGQPPSIGDLSWQCLVTRPHCRAGWVFELNIVSYTNCGRCRRAISHQPRVTCFSASHRTKQR